MPQAQVSSYPNAQEPRRFETPTFHPRSAFARTLRSVEIRRLERQREESGESTAAEGNGERR